MEKRFFKVLVLVLAVMVFLSACSSADLDSLKADNPDAVFVDDFSSSFSGWGRSSGQNGSTGYTDGTYRINVYAGKYDLWANPGLDLDNVSVEVDAVKIGGPDSNNYGVICRYQDDENFYYGEITSNGYYGIGKYKQGIQFALTGKFVATDLIHQGSETNHLKLTCAGSKLTLYINGSLAGSVDDYAFSSGDVGLIAGTFKEGGLEIAFDNFVVTGVDASK